MSIQFNCECGQEIRVKEEHAGKKGRCPGCKRILTIPMPQVALGDETELPMQSEAAADLSTRLPDAPPEEQPGLEWRDRLYLVLLLAMAPLLIHTFTSRDDLSQRLEQTLHDNPNAVKGLHEDADLDELLNALPDHRIVGATFGRDTAIHWVFAGVSGLVFFVLAMVILRSADTRPVSMLIVGLFTGTVGILLLLGFQYVADWTQGVWLRGRGIVTLLFYIAKFIGFSYRAAEDPSNGLLLSFVGFTCGVGFCEEVCKALPLLWHFRAKGTLGWRGACVWGLVSGAGFGVAEGIMYSARYYNGMDSGGLYAVRFISCVALHAIWTAAVGVSLYRNQLRIQGECSLWELLGWSAFIVLVPMVLHGAYDTLLKKDYQAWALVMAAASFAWLAYQIEKAGHQERHGGVMIVTE